MTTVDWAEVRMFDVFKNFVVTVFELNPASTGAWLTATCSCWLHLRAGVCPHVLSVCVKSNCRFVDGENNNIAVNGYRGKPKVGRPRTKPNPATGDLFHTKGEPVYVGDMRDTLVFAETFLAPTTRGVRTHISPTVRFDSPRRETRSSSPVIQSPGLSGILRIPTSQELLTFEDRYDMDGHSDRIPSTPSDAGSPGENITDQSADRIGMAMQSVPTVRPDPTNMPLTQVTPSVRRSDRTPEPNPRSTGVDRDIPKSERIKILDSQTPLYSTQVSSFAPNPTVRSTDPTVSGSMSSTGSRPAVNTSAVLSRTPQHDIASKMTTPLTSTSTLATPVLRRSARTPKPNRRFDFVDSHAREDTSDEFEEPPGNPLATSTEDSTNK